MFRTHDSLDDIMVAVHGEQNKSICPKWETFLKVRRLRISSYASENEKLFERKSMNQILKHDAKSKKNQSFSAKLKSLKLKELNYLAGAVQCCLKVTNFCQDKRTVYWKFPEKIGSGIEVKKNTRKLNV